MLARFLSSPVFRWAAFAAVALPTFIFVAVKAGTASFTHDEAYTFLHYVPMSAMNILAMEEPFPNNHILNSLCMKFFSALFGNSELSLRLPNVLSFLVYIFAVNGMLQRLRSKWLVLPSLMVLAANPFLLDFFSLARGYGISIAMIACSMNRYMHYLEYKRTASFALSFSFAALAFIANFGTLYFLAALLAAHNLIFLRSVTGFPTPRALWWHNRVTLIGLLVLGLIMFRAVTRMAGLQIDFGGEGGLWDDTAMSLILNTTYYHSIPMFLLLKWVAAGMLLFLLLGWLAVFLLKARFVSSEGHAFFPFLVFFLVVAGSFLHHFLLGAPYLKDRFALYILPLFWLSVIFLLDTISSERWRAALTFPLALFAAVMVIHSVRVLDTRSFLIWRYDQDNAAVINRLREEKVKSPGIDNFQVGVSWFYEPSFNYYRVAQKLEWLQPFTREGPKPEDDLVYIAEQDTVLVREFNKNLILQRYPSSGSVLLKLQKP